MRNIPREKGLLRDNRGITYLFVMLSIVVLGLMATAAAKQWKTTMQREREAELLARGIEIQYAIGAYSALQKKGRVVPGEVYPMTLEELTRQPKPVLRKVYPDPLTGKEWGYVRDQAGRIKGVRSTSKEEPIKQHEFPPAVRHFDGLTRYTDWVFQYPSASTPVVPTVPGQQPASPGGTPTAPATPAAPAAPNSAQ